MCKTWDLALSASSGCWKTEDMVIVVSSIVLNHDVNHWYDCPLLTTMITLNFNETYVSPFLSVRHGKEQQSQRKSTENMAS